MKTVLDMSKETAVLDMAKSIEQILITYKPMNIIFVCIGTDRSTGDCYGPLTGTFISKMQYQYKNVKVYGTLEQPVHAVNLKKYIYSINLDAEQSFIIALDASLGANERIGKMIIKDSPLLPGAGANKKLPAVGDMAITPIINISCESEALSYTVLSNTRLSLIYKLATITSSAIEMAMWNYTISRLEEAAVSM